MSALDVSVQSRILNLLHDLQERLNLTYLFISHDMSVVRHVADRIAVMYLGKIVETAPAAEIFDNPLHPYTQALLSSVPTLTRRRFTKRIVLEGDVPTAIDPPEACRFASRCFRVIERCRSEVPPLEGIAGDAGHRVACFNYEPIVAEPKMKAEAVQATTADGVTLRGELVRGGDVWICLVHDVGEDIDAWRPLRPGLARKGWSVLALDLRGHGGSDGEWTDESGRARRRPRGDARAAARRAPRLRRRGRPRRRDGAPAVERALPEPPFALPDSLVLVSAGPLGGIDPDGAARSGPAEALRARREGSAGRRLRGAPQGLDRLDGRRHVRDRGARIGARRGVGRERARQDRRPAQGADEAPRPRREAGSLRLTRYQAEMS